MKTKTENTAASRAAILDAAMLSDGVKICGIAFRRISLCSLAMLARVGNPLADTEAAETLAAPKLSDLAEFVFVHGAEPALVRECVYRDSARFAEEADVFCAAFPPSALAEIVAALRSDAAQVNAAQAEAVPDASLPASKNAPSPAA